MKLIFKISLRNVILHWRQSLASIISLAAGLISLVLFQGYMKDIQTMYQESFRSRMMYGDIIIEHIKMKEVEGRSEPWKYGISAKDQEFIQASLRKSENQINSIVQFLSIDGAVTNGKSNTIFRGLGQSLKSAEMMRGKDWAWNAIYGKPLNSKHQDEVMLGQSLGKILGCRPNKKEHFMDSVAGYKAEVRPFHCDNDELQLSVTTKSGTLNAIDLKVVGLVDALYKDIDDKYLVTSLESAQMLMNTQDVSSISVKLKDPKEQVDQLVYSLNLAFKKADLNYYAIRWEEHRVGEMYVRTMDLLSIFRNFVVSIILVIAVLAIFNTMLKLVKERTREIGTLRSIGFTPQLVLFLFITEAVILSFLGGFIGSLLALSSTFGVNALSIVYKAGVFVEPVPFRIMFSLSLYIWSFIFLSVLSGITTWFVCRSTLSGEAVENLTHS